MHFSPLKRFHHPKYSPRRNFRNVRIVSVCKKSEHRPYGQDFQYTYYTRSLFILVCKRDGDHYPY